MQKTERITQSTIISMGWTKAMIEKLLPEPTLATNPHYKKAAPMRLYEKSTVLSIMETAEFKDALEKANKRKLSSIKTIEKRKEHLLTQITDIADKIQIVVIDEESLISKTLSAKKEFDDYCGRDYEEWEYRCASPDTIERWVVNYIRHNLVDYDYTLYQIRGKVGKSEAYIAFKRNVLVKIATSYPKYADECRRQAEELDYMYLG